ncbi:MAG: V-type ATPase subunit [Clostridia bacterium]|nr:V-type ATPase subunit [Clostridia bacterium]
MRYDPSDYLYASARIRAMENRLLGREKLQQLLSLDTMDEVLSALADNGYDGEGGILDICQRHLEETFRTVADFLPDPTLIRFLQYPYDCHNLKVLEKCRVKGTDPAELLIDLGSIPAKDLLTVSENELADLLPPHMAAGLREARDAFDKTGNPREIDFVLDRAAYADMAAAASPFPLANQWVQAKADLTNLLICLRLLRMQSGDQGQALLSRTMLPGGTLDEAFLSDCYEGGESGLVSALARTPYGQIFGNGLPLSQCEKNADDFLIELTRRARAVSFGAEVPIAYLMAAETESKNLRILLAQKTVGDRADITKERMRNSYV